MNGVEFARRLLTVTPYVPIVLISGWGLDHDVQLPVNVVQLLGKPLTMKALEDALSRDGVLSAGLSMKNASAAFGS
jgi:two-component SAPR family response regulator